MDNLKRHLTGLHEEQICYDVYDTYRRAQIVHRYAAKTLSETKYRTLMRNVVRMLAEKDKEQVERLEETISQHKRKADDLVEDKDEEIKRLKGRRHAQMIEVDFENQ